MTITPVVGPTSQVRTTPYLSVPLFQSMRRGVNLSQLVPQGEPDEQDAELGRYIESASAEADSFCLQTLVATSDTVIGRVNVNRQGYAVIHPRFRPVIGLNSFAWGSPGNIQAVQSLAAVEVEPNRFTVPLGSAGLLTTSSAGPIQFGTAAGPMDQVWVQYTYTNGYPHTVITAPLTGGSNVAIPVADTTGIVAGHTWLTIYPGTVAGGSKVSFYAGTVSTAPSGGLGTGPGTVICPVLPQDIPYDPQFPVMISALPSDFIEAIARLTRAAIKSSGGGSVTAGSVSTGGGAVAADPYGGDMDRATAFQMLKAYMVPVEYT